jgi:hypothetical protein
MALGGSKMSTMEILQKVLGLRDAKIRGGEYGGWVVLCGPGIWARMLERHGGFTRLVVRLCKCEGIHDVDLDESLGEEEIVLTQPKILRPPIIKAGYRMPGRDPDSVAVGPFYFCSEACFEGWKEDVAERHADANPPVRFMRSGVDQPFLTGCDGGAHQ